MKVRTKHPHFGTRDIDLSNFLKPVNTSSAQGAVEQVAAELETIKDAYGNLLAALVEKKIFTLEEAMDISGNHFAYRQYKHGDIELLP